MNIPFSGGVAATGAVGQYDRISFEGTWLAGETWSLFITAGAVDYTFGAGDVSGVLPTFATTVDNKLYFLAGSTFYFSSSAVPTGFEQQDTNAGFITSVNRVAASEALTWIGSYQGKLAVLSRNTSQIWTYAADQTSYTQDQILTGVGTQAPLSVQAIGDLDVIMLHDSGVRSLRVRDNSLNAYVVDIGSAVDALVVGTLSRCSEAEKVAACAGVDPTGNRYNLFVKDTGYTLSYFPQSKVIGWSTFVYAVAPVKFVSYAGQLYYRGTDNKIYLYGGLQNTTYDATVPTVVLPWLDCGHPGNQKSFLAVDVIVRGSWTIYFGVDFDSNTYQTVGAVDEPTLNKRRITLRAKGTHFSVKLVGCGSDAGVVSSVIVYYNEEER